MIEILKYIVWGFALFLAVTVALDLFRPGSYKRSQFVSVTLWWLTIYNAWQDFFSVFHLVWLMIVAGWIPRFFELQELGMTRRYDEPEIDSHPRLWSISLKSLIVFAIPYFALIYFSNT